MILVSNEANASPPPQQGEHEAKVLTPPEPKPKKPKKSKMLDKYPQYKKPRKPREQLIIAIYEELGKPVFLAGSIGYYTGSNGAQGLGGSFGVNKTFFVGGDQGDQSGFRIDPGLFLRANGDLRPGGENLDQMDLRITALAAAGLRETGTLDVSFFPMGARYIRDSGVRYTAVGYELALLDIYLRAAFGRLRYDHRFLFDIFGRARLANVIFGKSQADQFRRGHGAFNPLEFTFGMGVAIPRVGMLRDTVQMSAFLGGNSGECTEENPGQCHGYWFAWVRNGLSLEHIGGTPVGLQWEVSYNYAKHERLTGVPGEEVVKHLGILRHNVGVTLSW